MIRLLKETPVLKATPGTDSAPEISNAKKELIDNFINNLKFQNGNYIIGSQQLGCD